MDLLPITQPIGVLAVLSGICAVFYWLEQHSGWRLFQYLPPLIFIYLTPVVLTNTGILTLKSPVYDAMESIMLPMLLVMLLLNVNIGGALSAMGRGILVMFFGTAGVILGAPVAFLAVRHWLGPDGWKAFGTLAGSWIGGTANMAAVRTMLDTPGTERSLAVLADSAIYPFWLPVLLASKKFADRFGRFTGVEVERLQQMREAARKQQRPARPPTTRDYLYLLSTALAVTWLADLLASLLPEIHPYLTHSASRILLITTIALILSFTPLNQIPGSQELALALVFLFVAQMGASAEVESKVFAQAIPFLTGAVLWIVIHGAFCILGAKLLRADIHTAAIASAANIGGVASASIVASYHQHTLVPAAILMALLGYAFGNYCAYLAAMLCWIVS
jgi:uncharacterized membrane protein